MALTSPPTPHISATPTTFLQIEPHHHASAQEALEALNELPSTVDVKHLTRNIFLLQLFCFIMGLSFLSPVFVLYLRTNLSGSATSVSWILAAQSITIFTLELPSGMLADLVGRRSCLIMCIIFRSMGLGILALLDFNISGFGFQSRFCSFILAGICEGISQALGSGTDVALLHDSLAAAGRAGEFPAALARRSTMWPIAACAANLIGGWMAEGWNTSVCIYATAFATLLGLPVAWSLREVYPRVYDPERMWRKRKEGVELQRRRSFDLIDSANTIEHTNGNGAVATTLTPRSASEEPVSSNLRSRKKKHHLDATYCNTSDSAAAITGSNPVKPKSSHLRPPCIILPTTDCIASAELNACPSPLSAHAPPSFKNFFALLMAHLALCMRTLKASGKMQSLLIFSSVLYASSEPPHRLRALFFTAHGIQPAMFGAVAGTMFGLSSFGAFLSEKLCHAQQEKDRIGAKHSDGGHASTTSARKHRERNILLATCLIPPILQFLSTYCSGLLSAIVLLPISLLWGIRLPLLSGLLHRELHSSNQRATVASMQSLANKLALAVCLAGVAGPLTDAYSIDTTVRVFAIASVLPAVWVATRLD